MDRKQFKGEFILFNTHHVLWPIFNVLYGEIILYLQPMLDAKVETKRLDVSILFSFSPLSLSLLVD